MVEVALGPPIAEGREAQVYAWGTDAVLKLYRPGYAGYRAESAALARLDGVGVAPRLIEQVHIDGRHGLVLRRMAGQDMLTLLQRRPWRLPEFARTMAEAQLRINREPAPVDLPDLVEVLATRIAATGLDRQLRQFALRCLTTLPAGDRLCHGDLHPANVLITAGQPAVIDWGNATRAAPDADLARTMLLLLLLLLLRHADPLPGTSPLTRSMIAAGRTAFTRAFVRAYRHRSAQPPRQVDQWTIVHAAARLAEGITVEEPILVEIIRRAWLRRR